MVIDTSAFVSILLAEPEAAQFARTIRNAPRRLLSAVSRVELSLVIEGRYGAAGRAEVDRILGDQDIEIVAVTPAHAELAVDAFRRFGKGRHRAGLNLGDCFAYALARATGEPLLYKGDDFVHTDIAAATA